jgi:transcriptional regulator with XRE-family HTH domain
MSIIGDKMRELRGSSSQREMADAIGIKYNAWARYEAGGALPGAEIIERICRVHACSADWLLGLKDNAAPTVTAGAGAAVAIGSHAKATSKLSTPNSPTPNCTKCPHLKKLKKLEALLKKAI